MFAFAKNIAPLLTELDELVPVTQPVQIDVLIDLTKRHACLSGIQLRETTRPSIVGTHILTGDARLLLIYFRPCSVHAVGKPNRICPECRKARYIIAKELSHAFDDEDEQTCAADVEELIIKERLKNSYANKHALADLFGTLWGLELLFRYSHRVELTGGGALAPSQHLTSARTTNDYSFFANQFCIPPEYAGMCLDDAVMDAMKTARQKAGLAC